MRHKRQERERIEWRRKVRKGKRDVRGEGKEREAELERQEKVEIENM